MERILHVNKFAHGVGGVETHVRLLMAQQAEQGKVVELFSSRDVAGGGFDASAASYRRKAASAVTLLWSQSARRALEARIATFRPDVVHFHSIYHHLSPSVLASARAAGIASVMTLHDYKLAAPCYLLLRNGHECTLCVGRTVPAKAVRYRCVKGSVTASVICAVEQATHKSQYRRGVDAFIVPSDAAASYLAASEAVEPARLHVVPHGVPVPQARAALADDPPQLLFIGRLAPEKGVTNLLEAWSRAALAAPWEMVVVGEGVERGALERRARGLRVRFLGHLDERSLETALTRASVVAVPSLAPETFGLAPAEAMAYGIPTLVSDAGNLPELVGNRSQIISAHDVAGWSDAIRWVAASRRQRVELGLAGRDRIRRMFDPKEAASRVDAIYEAARLRHPAGDAR